MPTEKVDDLSLAPSHSELRRFWVRLGVPVGGVLLVIAAILAIVLYSHRVNRAGVLALSDDLLAGLQARIAQQVTNYLEPATRAARLARRMLAQKAVLDRNAALQAYAASALREIPQIDSFYIANDAGDFMLVRRGTGGGTDTKLIQNAPARHVEWIHRDASGTVTGTEQTPQDDFDPRTRTWYQGALKSSDVFWTGVYVFFTARVPGVTAAIRYHDPNGTDTVFGVDITLDKLSRFLAGLHIGRTGRAVIFDDAGHLIAVPDTNPEHILRGQGDQLTTARLDQLGDPALTGAYDRFRVEGYGRRLIRVDGQPIDSIAAPLPGAASHWSLLIVVPERDFTGFVATNSQRALALSLPVVLLTALLAALLVRQGLRADRTARLLLDRGKAVEQQSSAFAALARQPALFDPMNEAGPRQLTETLAELTAARRVSVWRMMDAGRKLRAEDAYERESAGHVSGLEFSRTELPQFFAALAAGELITSSDAANDPRTAELHRVLMQAFDSRAVTVMPVFSSETLVGAIMLVDAEHLDAARDFLLAAANMLAIRLSSGKHEETSAPVPAAETSASPTILAGERNFTAELALRGLTTDVIGADVLPSVAVMVIKFDDPAAIASHATNDSSVLADRIAEALQEIADAHALPYMKLVSQDVVAAAGLTPADSTAIVRIADAALTARERCLELFEECGRPPAFHIGIDYGIAIGSHVGRNPRLFNLWGEAVRTAETMANSGPGAGTIQASEAAYRRLRQQFLFRPRGSFYIPRVGPALTFVLATRL